MSMSAAFTAMIAIGLDTAFYKNAPVDFVDLLRRPVITPLNNLRYNTNTSNLAIHGLHPFYQHVAANLPQLLGPAFLLLFRSYRKTMRLASALSGVLILSIFPHQEARFLLPALPLILSSLRLPINLKLRRAWVAAWVLFNAALGLLMGLYHQGGVVPAQMHLAATELRVAQVFWWKTYSPPIWLLNGKNENLTTTDLMGMRAEEMMARLREGTPCDTSMFASPKLRLRPATLLVAPRSAYYLRPFVQSVDDEEKIKERTDGDITLQEVWSYRRHLNLDDMDFGGDGVWPTISRVVGDRGLVIYKVIKHCNV
jgi:GPI mannosyltransferase 4